MGNIDGVFQWYIIQLMFSSWSSFHYLESSLEIGVVVYGTCLNSRLLCLLLFTKQMWKKPDTQRGGRAAFSLRSQWGRGAPVPKVCPDPEWLEPPSSFSLLLAASACGLHLWVPFCSLGGGVVSALALSMILCSALHIYGLYKYWIINNYQGGRIL